MNRDTSTRLRDDLYRSRDVARPSITPRIDPVVHGDADGPLDPELVQAYEDEGFLVIPNLLPPRQAADIDAEIEALAGDAEVRARPQAILEPGSDVLRSLFEVHRGEGPLAGLARHPRLVAVARQLLGGDVYVHQSRVNLKPGFRGEPFSWHSDFETWHTEDGMPRMRALSCSVLLTENHADNGPLLAIAGSHQWFVACVGATPEAHFEHSLRRQEIGVPDEERLRELVDRGRIASCLGQPGTVVFFDCNLMHGSNSNITPDPRRNVFLVYNSVDNALEEPFAAPAPRPEHIASRTFTPV